MGAFIDMSNDCTIQYRSRKIKLAFDVSLMGR